MPAFSHLPVSIAIEADGIIRISQPMSFDDPQDMIHIDLSADQAVQIAHFLLTMTKKAPAAAPAAASDHFDAFWQLYPSKRRVDREGCLKKWKVRKLDTQHEIIMSQLSAMIASDSWKSDGGKYVPLITTYLNQSRWQAEVDVAEPTWQPPQV